MSNIEISSASLSVVVSPLGAEAQEIKTADGRSWLWNGSPEFWTGRSPILFPIVGKAPDDTIEIDGRSFPLSQHGFARRSEFTLVEKTQTECSFELTSSDKTRAVFPFDFRLTIRHKIDGNMLRVSARVENTGEGRLPFGIGFHPAFVWPLPGAEGRTHRIRLENGAEPALLRLKSGLLDATPLPSPFTDGDLKLDHPQFDLDAMIFPEGAGAGLVYFAEDGAELRFRFENLPNLALWTKPGAPFICIEPWHGMAALAGEGQDIRKRPFTTDLAAGAFADFSMEIAFPEN